jgi:hypothetical protein
VVDRSVDVARQDLDVNENTLVSVHCYQGDADLVREFMPQYTHHECPVVVLSPADSPVEIAGVDCRSAGKRGYFGQDSLDRQREHLKLLLTYPQRYFLLNDADSFCLSPELPAYLYKHENVLWSNEVTEGRPHDSPYPKLGVHPPYFLTRATIEKMLTVNVPAHPITPFIDWYMLALACEAGVGHAAFPDGRSFPAWRHGAIAETKELGHDFHHEETAGGVDGARMMASQVRSSGVIFIHSVKHSHVRDELVAAFKIRRNITLREPRVQRPPKPNGKTSILVAFRDTDGTRTRLWDFVRAYYERTWPEAEIVCCSDDGEDPFHKTLALNRAAAKATGDVFVIGDADTLVDTNVLREAVQAVRTSESQWAHPYNQKVKLNEAATEYILGQGAEWQGPLDLRAFGKMEGFTTFNAAPPLVVSRDAWDLVRGCDERFRGWGQEDQAMAQALTVMCGRPLRKPGQALHLKHNRIGVSGNDFWPGQDVEGKRMNIVLQDEYRRARSVDAMRKLVEERYDGRGSDDATGNGQASDGVRPVAVG